MQQEAEDASPAIAFEQSTPRQGTAVALAHAASVAVSRILAGLLIAHFTESVFPAGDWHLKGNSWTSGFLQWDSGWYLGIVHSGYSSPRFTAFFPGFPLFVRAIRAATFGSLSIFAAGVISAWLAFLAAVVLARLTFGQLLDPETARVATILFAWSPASIFFLSAYPEGMLVALSALALYFIGTGRYWWAAIASGFATLCSPLAVALPIAIFLGIVTQWRSLSMRVTSVMGVLAVSVWGLVAWMGYLTVRFQDPLIFMKEQRTFNRSMDVPFGAIFGVLAHISHSVQSPGIPQGNWYDTRLINLTFSILGLIVFIYFIAAAIHPRLRRFPVAFSTYAALTALIPAMSTQRFGGIPNPEAGTRLACDNLGLYAMLANFLRSRAQLILPALCLWVAVATFVQSVFTNGYYFT